MFQKELLRQITKKFAADTKVYTVLASFAETMLEPLLERYSLYPAKGTTIAHFAHNSDQMMSTHILNGLFPTLTLVYEAQQRNVLRLTRLDEEHLKIYILSYTMHDLDKILGDTNKFHTRTKVAVADARQKILAELEKLNAHSFLPSVEYWASEILWLAVNTQRSREINLSHTAFIASETLQWTDEVVEAYHPQQEYFRIPRIESTLRDLCTLSDLLAFLVKSPEEVLLGQSARRIGELIKNLTDMTSDEDTNHFTVAYHKLAEVRGFLSNHINNATIRYLSNVYPQDQEQLIPWLYFPNGVVYLNPALRPAPVIDLAAVNTAVQQEIKDACSEFIDDGKGFGFDPKGRLAYPRYFHDFLSLPDFLQRFAKNTLSESRGNVAENTLQAMRGLQARDLIPATIDLDYVSNRRITQLGRFLLNYVDLIQKNLGPAHLKVELEKRLSTRFGAELWEQAKQIPGSGGVDYRYYWLAAQFLLLHPLASFESDSLEGLFQLCLQDLLEVASEELGAAPDLQGFYLQDLADYLKKHLSFGFNVEAHADELPDFAGELTGYSAAKKRRNSQLSCTLCNSAYTTKKQEDASVIFQPWVYKNRLLLYKGENAGGICSICSLELMLRQVLLKDRPGRQGLINLTGKSYEDMELKYFFLYPGFFFTQQTFHLISYIIEKMSTLKLYEVCETLRAKEHLDVADILRLSFFRLTTGKLRAAESNEQDKKEAQEEKGGMYLFERYDEKQYPGFLFFAKKTFSKKKASGESSKATTASWVEAAWLGLALPLVTGARVVVTEEYFPLYNSASDFLETVVLDAPHQAIRYVLPQSSARLRLDELYGDRKDGDWIGGAMAALSRLIEVHVDTERVGGDLKLERFSRIAGNMQDDQLFLFSFLKEQVRRDRLDQLPGKKASHYNDLYQQFVAYYHSTEGDAMKENATRHEKATDLYLQFYLPFNERRTWPNSRAIVRPIDIAAQCILKDTLNLTEEEIKLEMFQALKSWLDIVDKKGATGRVIAHGPHLDTLVWQFVETFYQEVFCDYAQERRSVLNSRLNRFKGGCEAIFSLRYSANKKSQQDADQHKDVDQHEEEMPEVGVASTDPQ
jgi:CRISPR-associated protein Csc3